MKCRSFRSGACPLRVRRWAWVNETVHQARRAAHSVHRFRSIRLVLHRDAASGESSFLDDRPQIPRGEDRRCDPPERLLDAECVRLFMLLSRLHQIRKLKLQSFPEAKPSMNFFKALVFQETIAA